ncbi:hypothetical protein BJ170DRAFT_457055 [Xylariales sp. AK1849]|nr:hypothetical protein BJ170DRAFT_457055 [Xylariales sp. AK1849]
MQFLIIGLALLPTAFAAPLIDTEVTKQVIGDVRICTGTDFNEPCENMFVSGSGSFQKNCKQLPQQYIEKMGSYRPDHQTLCRLFDSAHSECTGTGVARDWYPGQANLFNLVGDPGHKAQYISCVRCDNCE